MYVTEAPQHVLADQKPTGEKSAHLQQTPDASWLINQKLITQISCWSSTLTAAALSLLLLISTHGKGGAMGEIRSTGVFFCLFYLIQARMKNEVETSNR